MAIAAGNVLWQLGSSSYFVDEILSVNAAMQPPGSLVHVVGLTEIAPPGYFAVLHEWIRRLGLSSRVEWTTRLPSALCAVALVAVVYALTRLLSPRRGVALGAAAICALSPFELEYAQRAQNYAAVGLTAAIAVTAAVLAEREGRRRSLWFGVSLAAAVASLLENYTAGLVVVPLCAWMFTRPSLSRLQRWGFIAVCAAVELALVPLLLTQHDAYPTRPGVESVAALTGSTLQGMLELPFSGRVSALRPLGVVVTVGSLLVLLVSRRIRSERGFGVVRLVAVIAVGVPLTLVALSALGGHAFWGHLMLNRYGAVAVPFTVVAIALAVESLPRPVGALLAVAVALVALTGTVQNHRSSSFYLDARQAAAYVRAHAQRGDVVFEPPYPGDELPLNYYGLARLGALPASEPGLLAVLRTHGQRVWLLSEVPAGGAAGTRAALAQAREVLRRYAYVPVAARLFPSTSPLLCLLAAPTRAA